MNHERIALRLYRTHRDTLVNYAGKLSGDRAGAEDIVQDAWLLMDRQPDEAVIREPIGYLRRIIRNLVFAQARRRSRETLVAVDDLRGLADDRPSAEAELAARQMMERILDTIDAMPTRQRAAIKMYHFEDMKLREIAERLGLSVSYTHRLIAEGMDICNQRRREGL
ncbi:MAG: RNA polymerase sigma factor [Hyphomonadaceae bacterium]